MIFVFDCFWLVCLFDVSGHIITIIRRKCLFISSLIIFTFVFMWFINYFVIQLIDCFGNCFLVIVIIIIMVMMIIILIVLHNKLALIKLGNFEINFRSMNGISGYFNYTNEWWPFTNNLYPRKVIVPNSSCLVILDWFC